VATAAPEIPVLARDQAFESLYRRYVKDVYHYALALLRNPADAEDVTQTTFLNAYRAYKRGEVIEKPQNWLIKIAHNACRTRFIRAQRRPQEVPLEDSIDRIAVPESERPNVRSILRALGQLPFNQRSALVMRELEGRTYEEIADTLGVSVSAVETLLFRARRSLRLKASSLRALTFVQLPSTLRSFWESGEKRGTLLRALVLGSLMACSIFCWDGHDVRGLRASAPRRCSVLPELRSRGGTARRHRGTQDGHGPLRRHRRLDWTGPQARR